MVEKQWIHSQTCIDEEGSKQGSAILKELENIDDECDQHNIDFVKISDPGVAPKFKLTHIPALIYFRRSAPIHYHGDLMDEDAVLKWVLTTKEEDVDVIEEVDEKTLEDMIEAHASLVVYFCKWGTFRTSFVKILTLPLQYLIRWEKMRQAMRGSPKPPGEHRWRRCPARRTVRQVNIGENGA